MKTVNLSEETNNQLDKITKKRQESKPAIVVSKKNVIAEMVFKAYKREIQK